MQVGAKNQKFFLEELFETKVMFVSPAFLVPVTTKGILTFKSIK